MRSMPLPPSVVDWQRGGRLVRLDGIDVFVREFGPADASEAVLILHGFPTSSFDFRHVAPALAEQRRVVLFDFPGYGLSAKPERYSYSLHEQADIVEAVAAATGLTQAHLVAHDMGTSVACELFARRERGRLGLRLSSVALLNGSIYIEMAHLTPSQRLLRTRLAPLFVRISTRFTFEAQIRRIVGRPLADEELEAMWAQLNYNDGRLRLPQSISYIDERYRFRERWIGALTRLDLPTLVLWGTEDPVAVFAIGERVAREVPGARLVPLRGIGHFPPLESPPAVSSALLHHFPTGSDPPT